VISGTAMDMVVCRWLQMGDPGGIYRRALAAFPDQGMAQRLIDKVRSETLLDPLSLPFRCHRAESCLNVFVILLSVCTSKARQSLEA
jgi:hypothetical protein